MKVRDILLRLSADTLVTVENLKKCEIIIDRDTVDRILAFDDVDKEIHNIVRNGNVTHIEVGKVYGDIILSILF